MNFEYRQIERDSQRFKDNTEYKTKTEHDPHVAYV